MSTPPLPLSEIEEIERGRILLRSQSYALDPSALTAAIETLGDLSCETLLALDQEQGSEEPSSYLLRSLSERLRALRTASEALRALSSDPIPSVSIYRHLRYWDPCDLCDDDSCEQIWEREELESAESLLLSWDPEEGETLISALCSIWEEESVSSISSSGAMSEGDWGEALISNPRGYGIGSPIEERISVHTEGIPSEALSLAWEHYRSPGSALSCSYCDRIYLGSPWDPEPAECCEREGI